MKRGIFDDGYIRNDYTRRMCADIARHTFHLGSRRYQLRKPGIGPYRIAEFGNFFQTIIQRNGFSAHRHFNSRRNQFADTVYFRQGDIHHPPDIAYGTFRTQCVESNNL